MKTMTWKNDCKKDGRDFYPRDFRGFMKAWKLRPATIHETMGPNWKDIVWSPANRPFVVLGRKGD